MGGGVSFWQGSAPQSVTGLYVILRECFMVSLINVPQSGHFLNGLLKFNLNQNVMAWIRLIDDVMGRQVCMGEQCLNTHLDSIDHSRRPFPSERLLHQTR